MAQKVAANASPWIDSYNILTANYLSHINYGSKPQTFISHGTGCDPTMDNSYQIGSNVEAAYLLALRWKISGNTSYADASVNILNQWSSTLTGFGCINGSGGEYLLIAGIQGYQFANTAEILRSYSGFTAANFTAFKNMMSKPLKTKVLETKNSIANLMKILEMFQTDCLEIEIRNNTEELMLLKNDIYRPLFNDIKQVLWHSKQMDFFINSKDDMDFSSLDLPSPGFLFICENMGSLQDLSVNIEYDLNRYYPEREITLLLRDYTFIMRELERIFICASKKMKELNTLDINLMIKSGPGNVCSREEKLEFIKKILLMIHKLNLKKLFDGIWETSLTYKMSHENECCIKMDSIIKLPNSITNVFDTEICFNLSNKCSNVSMYLAFIFK